MPGVITGPVPLLASIQCHVSKTCIDLAATGHYRSQRILLYKVCTIKIECSGYTISDIREGAKNIPRGGAQNPPPVPLPQTHTFGCDRLHPPGLGAIGSTP